MLPAREPARAKVNLNLAIVGRDAAGYHLLETLMAFADGAQDMLTLDGHGEAADTLRSTCAGRSRRTCPGEERTTWSSCLRRASSGRRRPALPPLRWTLDKTAARRSRHRRRLGRCRRGAPAHATRIRSSTRPSSTDGGSSQLGADVPAAFHGRATWATGRGEVLTPITLPPLAGGLGEPERGL